MLLAKVKKDDFMYGALNISGGLALTYYAITIGSLPFAILELVWVFASFGNLLKNTRIVVKRLQKRNYPEN